MFAVLGLKMVLDRLLDLKVAWARVTAGYGMSLGSTRSNQLETLQYDLGFTVMTTTSKIITYVLVCIVMGSTSSLADEITLKIPVKLTGLMDVVISEVVCRITDDKNQTVSASNTYIELVEGSFDDTITMTLQPKPGLSFSRAKNGMCQLRLFNSCEDESCEMVEGDQIKYSDGSGKAEDWKYAKSGTELSTSFKFDLPE